MRHTADTRRTLDESGDGTHAHQGAHADRESVYAVSNARPFKIEGDGVPQPCELGHGVQSSNKTSERPTLSHAIIIHPVVSEKRSQMNTVPTWAE